VKKSKAGQIKFTLSDEMLADLEKAAQMQGHSVSAEVRARVLAFREEHRLVEITRWVPASEISKEN
jgi:hypothetical protein